MKISRKSLVFLALLVPSINHAQKLVRYEDVITINSTKKQELFLRAVKYLNENYQNLNNDYQIKDTITNEVSFKTKFSYSNPKLNCGNHTLGVIWYNLSIIVKDNKYKIIFENFIHESETVAYTPHSYGFIYETEKPFDKFFCEEFVTNRKGVKNCIECYEDMKAKIQTEVDKTTLYIKKQMSTKSNVDW